MRIVLSIVLVLALSGCIGAYRTTPVSPATVDGLAPATADPDAGLVSLDPSADLRAYRTVFVQAFTVNTEDIKDEEDRKLAVLMPALLQSELVVRLRASRAFERVVNLGETAAPTDAGPALRVEGTLSRLAAGSRALRYFVGFGAGAAKAQVETRFIDVATGKAVLVTADRREAAFGIFGGDSEEHLREALSDTARDLAKLVARLKATAPTASTPSPGSGPTAAGVPGIAPVPVPLAGTWRAGDGRSVLVISGSADRLRWELETTDALMMSLPFYAGSTTVYRASGGGAATGDEIALSGRITAGDGQAMNRPFTLTLTRDGQRLRGTALGSRNVPHAVDFTAAEFQRRP